MIAAVTSAELELVHHEVKDAKLDRVRREAYAAAAKFLREPSERSRREARAIADQCSALYEPYEDDPDTDESKLLWNSLGAPWFAAEAAGEDYELQAYDGPGQATESQTWRNRAIVWPKRAIDSASQYVSQEQLSAKIEQAILSDLQSEQK